MEGKEEMIKENTAKPVLSIITAMILSGIVITFIFMLKLFIDYVNTPSLDYRISLARNFKLVHNMFNATITLFSSISLLFNREENKIFSHKCFTITYCVIMIAFYNIFFLFFAEMNLLNISIFLLTLLFFSLVANIARILKKYLTKNGLIVMYSIIVCFIVVSALILRILLDYI